MSRDLTNVRSASLLEINPERLEFHHDLEWDNYRMMVQNVAVADSQMHNIVKCIKRYDMTTEAQLGERRARRKFGKMNAALWYVLPSLPLVWFGLVWFGLVCFALLCFLFLVADWY